MSRGRVATALLAVVVPVLSGCGGSGEGSGPAAIVDAGDQGPYAGAEIDPPFPMPTATLVDDTGEQVRVPDDLDGTVRLFFYGYTQCPDVCPLIMSDLAVAVARLPEDVAEQVEVVMVTSDPARDDPAALAEYLDRFDPDFTGLTGDLDTIVAMAGQMGIEIKAGRRLPSGGYEVAHGAEVVGYAGDGAPVVWTDGTSAADIAADVVRLVEAGT